MIKKIEHIGVAVKSVDESIHVFRDILGIPMEKVYESDAIKTKIAFFPVGGSTIELVEPLDPESPVAKFIEKKGAGFQHVAFRVENIEEALAELKAKGVQLIDQVPRKGAGGAKIAFLHPKATGGVLVELCERS